MTWLLSDHLGSTTETIAAGDAWLRPFNYSKLNWTLYKPWGQTRYASGTTATKSLFTGQRSESSSMNGVYFFKARFCDSMAALTEVDMGKIIRFRRDLIALLLTVSLLAAGCAAKAEVILTPTIEIIFIPTIASPTIAPSPTPSLSPEPSETPQPPNQLTTQEKKTIIANFVRTNNHCALPCFMGVELQQSTLEEIETLFSPSMGPGLVTRDQSANEVVYGSGFETINLIRGDFGIRLHDGETDGIHLYLGGLWRPEVSMEDWAPYTLRGVFSQLGPPSRILFKIHGPPNEPSESDQGMIIYYYLYYEPNDAIIAYNGQKTEDVPQFYFCPMQQKPEFIGITIGSYTKDITVTGTDLEEASRFTVKEFYNMDWSNPDTCIDLDIAVLKSHP